MAFGRKKKEDLAVETTNAVVEDVKAGGDDFPSPPVPPPQYRELKPEVKELIQEIGEHFGSIYNTTDQMEDERNTLLLAIVYELRAVREVLEEIQKGS